MKSLVAKKSNLAGFTIIELLIAVSVAAIVSAILVTICVELYGTTVKQQIYSEMIVESQQVLVKMLDDVRFSDTILAANSIADPNNAGGWTTSAPTLVVGEPAYDSTRKLIYDPSTSYPYKNNIIYFLSGSTMYRRVLKNTNATGNVAITTCPSAVASCPKDIELATRVASLSFIFYDSDNNVTATSTSARSVQVSIVMSSKTFGQTISLTNTLRGTLRNN